MILKEIPPTINVFDIHSPHYKKAKKELAVLDNLIGKYPHVNIPILGTTYKVLRSAMKDGYRRAFTHAIPYNGKWLTSW
jgi:hypothetical protein